jgi:hypothetical protein
MAAGLQINPEFGVVIYLAIVDDPHCAVFVAHWLPSGVQINNAQPAVAKPNGTGAIFSGFVRATMPEQIHHLT